VQGCLPTTDAQSAGSDCKSDGFTFTCHARSIGQPHSASVVVVALSISFFIPAQTDRTTSLLRSHRLMPPSQNCQASIFEFHWRSGRTWRPLIDALTAVRVDRFASMRAPQL
jgi:hypothetical protein